MILLRHSTTTLAVLMLAVSLTSCATMFNSGTQTVQVRPTRIPGHDEIRNLRVEVKGPRGTFETSIPGTVVLEPANDIEIRVTEQCFEPTLVKVGASITPSYWANIPGIFIYVGLFGFFVDPMTGAMWKLNSDTMIPVRPVENFDACRSKSKG